MSRLLIIRLLLLQLLFVAGLLQAETIVRFTVQQGMAKDTVDIRLFDRDKPITVNNFMSYIVDGSYNNSFIHRSIPGFIIQGGGYGYDPGNSDFITSILPIPNKSTINNEPGIANTRGTIAMARPAGQVDGATSEWFINLVDNSSMLVPADGGSDAYTVFGEVINNGMQVFDSIAGLPIVPQGGAFNQIPLVDYLVAPVLTSNLARISNVEGLIKISSDYDFGTVTPKSNLQPEFFIKNISNRNILIGGIGNTDPAETPFRITDLECSNTILLPGEGCIFVVSFRPVTSNIFTDSFNIEFPELGLNYTINLTGSGGPTISESDISQAFSSFGFRSANYGEVDIANSSAPITYSINLGYQNLGDANLNITAIDLITSQADEFTLQGDCLNINFLVNSQVCSLVLDFTPLSRGDKMATVRISSDDPDESTFDFVFKAVALAENDGVDELIENAGPNNGDGNYDGILDSKQSNVVSLPASNGQYITLIADNSIRYRNVRFVDPSELPPVPVNVVASIGILRFTIDGLKLDEEVKAGMILPVSTAPVSYFVYGPDGDTSLPGWFDFSPDSTTSTGTQIVSGASFITKNGQTIPGTFVTLYLKNAVRGDEDFKTDNKVTVTGAFNIPVTTSSGRLHIIVLCFLFLILSITRLYYFRKLIKV